MQDALGKTCHVNRLERQTTSLSNMACLFAWVWAWIPEDISTSRGFSIINRPLDPRGRQTLPEGCPRDKGLEGLEFSLLIHLDTTLPSSFSRFWLCDPPSASGRSAH